MSEEIYGMVQILELTGRMAGGIFRGIRMSARDAKKGVDLIRLKRMQLKMKLHYASTGEHNTMNLKDLEKLTGGEYAVLNIPFEDEKNLIGFYDRLKKLEVPFAELPDLNIGDGYTQIAYNPQDAEKIQVVVSYFKEKMEAEACEISLEKYEEMGGEKGKKVLDELAQKGYEKESHMNLLQTIRDRNKDKEYIPVTINIEALLKEETKDAYICNVPGTYKKGQGYSKTITINKEDCVILDKGQTIYTHLKRGDPETDQIAKNWHKVSKEHRKASERIRLEDTDALPNFNKGQESQKEPALEKTEINGEQESQKKPVLEETGISKEHGQEKEELASLDHIFEQPLPEEGAKDFRENNQGKELESLDRIFEQPLPGQSVKDFRENNQEKEPASLDHILGEQESAEQVVENILKIEGMKEKVSSGEHIPVTVPLDDCLVAETKNIYVVKLPGTGAENAVEMITIPKKDTVMSDDMKSITIFFEKDGKTNVDLHDASTGKTTEKKTMKNDDLAMRFGKMDSRMKEQNTVKDLVINQGVKTPKVPDKIRKG